MSEELNLNELEQVSGGNDGLGGEFRPANVKTGTNYVIQAGDTLSSIGAKFGVKWQSIFEANKSVIIAEANRHGLVYSDVSKYADHIWPGTAIVIP
jgi:nucleoid-associated protein YgaU